MLKKGAAINIITVIIVGIAIISLFFTTTNFVPISALISLTIVVFPFLFFTKNKKNDLTIVLFILFVYLAINLILYNYNSLFNYDFYRRDGNIFITYAPLLVLPLLCFKINTKKILDLFLPIITIINLITMIIFFIFRKTAEYFFLFYAHNAAGGFLTTIICITLGMYIEKKDKKYLMYTIINIIGLVLTDSRGSMIGLVIAIICFVLNKKTRIKVWDIIAFMMIILVLFITMVMIINFMGETVLLDNGQNFELPEKFKDTSVDSLISIIGRSHTIVNRVFYLWPRAIKLFTISPIYGTGFGSFNDIPYDFNKLFLFNNSNNIINSDSHAHNSYFHILAETGIIGFGLLIMFIYIIRKNILNITIHIGIKYGLYITWLSIIFSSFTEHRITTPSQLLPFVIILGFMLMEENYKNKNKYVKRKIIINGRFLTQKITGVQRYACEVVKQLDKISVEDEIIIVHPKNIINKLELKNIKLKQLNLFKGHLWEQIALPLYILFNDNCTLISLCNIAPILYPGNVVLHDISFKTHSSHLNKKFAMWYNIITNFNIKRYKHIFTVSEFSKNEILDNYKIDSNKITVTYNSANHLLGIKEDNKIIDKLNLHNLDFIFSLGSNSPHKNQKFVLECAKNNPDIVFVITGNSNKIFMDEEKQELNNVIFTGYLSDEEITCLYKRCKAFLFPSIYEGFGIPPLEALILECKNVIVSNIPVFKEIYNNNVKYIDINTQGIGLKKVLAEKCNTNKTIFNKYSWEKITEKIVKNIE